MWAFIVANEDKDFRLEEDMDHPVRCQFIPDLRPMIWSRRTFIGSFPLCTTEVCLISFLKATNNTMTYLRLLAYHPFRLCNQYRRPLFSVFAHDEKLVE